MEFKNLKKKEKKIFNAFYYNYQIGKCPKMGTPRMRIDRDWLVSDDGNWIWEWKNSIYLFKMLDQHIDPLGYYNFLF